MIIAAPHSKLDLQLGTPMYANELQTSWYNRHKVRHKTLPACESRRRDGAQNPGARFSVPPPPKSFHPTPTFLLSPKNGPVCFTRKRHGAWRRDKTIISLAAADMILTQTAVLSLRHPPTCPTVVGVFQTLSLLGTNVPKLIFQANVRACLTECILF